MAGELFKAMAGVSILHIPYKGSSGARTDVLGGQVDLMFDAVPTMTEHIRAGKVKALGTTGTARSAVMPDVPTIAEAGVPGYEATIWLGLMAPKNTPPPIVARLNAEIAKIVGQPDVAKAWEAQGATPMTMSIDRVHALPQRRHRQVGAHRQGLGREARPMTPPRRTDGGDCTFSAPAPVKGLVLALRPASRRAPACASTRRFGAVGAMRKRCSPASRATS